MKLILVRHGETDKNVQEKVHHTDDRAPLTTRGILQMEKTAIFLKKYNPAIVYSSGKTRTIQSAKIIADALLLETKIIDGMHERNWGKHEGLEWKSIEEKLNALSLEERYIFKPSGGESWKEFEHRLLNTIEKLSSAHQEDTVIVVTHGGAIRALLPHLLGKPKEESFKFNPENASVTVCDVKKKEYSIVLVDSINHLTTLSNYEK